MGWIELRLAFGNGFDKTGDGVTVFSANHAGPSSDLIDLLHGRSKDGFQVVDCIPIIIQVDLAKDGSGHAGWKNFDKKGGTTLLCQLLGGDLVVALDKLLVELAEIVGLLSFDIVESPYVSIGADHTIHIVLTGLLEEGLTKNNPLGPVHSAGLRMKRSVVSMGR